MSYQDSEQHCNLIRDNTEIPGSDFSAHHGLRIVTLYLTSIVIFASVSPSLLLIIIFASVSSSFILLSSLLTSFPEMQMSRPVDRPAEQFIKIPDRDDVRQTRRRISVPESAV